MMLPLALLIGASMLEPFHLTEEKAELTDVKARTLTLHVPNSWKKVNTTSSMRAAQFSLPEKVELVVYYFGGPTGGVKANIDRWIGQFAKEDVKLKVTQGKCEAGRYILVDCLGTWNKPDGPPFAQKTIATPNSRVLNVILIEEAKDKEEDYYFMKLAGPAPEVAKHIESLRSMIGADMSKEKSFKLDD